MEKEKKTMANLLIVDDEVSIHKLLIEILEPKGHICTAASDAEQARQLIDEKKFELLISDIDMPGESGLDFVKYSLSEYPDTAALMITGFNDPLVAKSALEIGVYDYITKPFERNRLIISVTNALRRRELEIENRDHKEHLEAQVRSRTENIQLTIRDLEKTQAALQESEEKFRQIGASAQEAIIMMDPEGKVSYWNGAAENMFGYSALEAMNKDLHSLIAPKRYHEEFQKNFAQFRKTGQGPVVGQMIEVTAKHSFGNEFPIELSLSAMKLKDRLHALGIIRDISERKGLEAQLVQAQKLESIGQLAAGIAHEINTPIQYVGYNTHFLKEQFESLDPLLDKYQELFQAAKAGKVPDDLLSELESTIKDVDLAFIREEVPPAIGQTLEGVEHVSKIVRAMKEFSHPGTEAKTQIDINKAIESTVMVSRNEWKYVAELTTDLDSNLPLVPCLPADFNQVILNMIVNAAHAIGDVMGDGSEKGTISIDTTQNNGWAEIRIKDTGTGIAKEHRSRIFDPFFTTKEIGKGTGQGLAISHSIITDKHGGTLNFETEIGKGTTFIIRLPIEQDSK